jgi:hypothetical protein
MTYPRPPHTACLPDMLAHGTATAEVVVYATLPFVALRY